MTVSLRYGLRSDVGHVREGNEDSGYAGSRLVAVADGMGGPAAGEVASRVVIGRLAALDEDAAGPDLLGALESAVHAANDDLRAMVARDTALTGMGTTLTALYAAGQRLGLVHVGDSRCYLYRDGELTLVTRDHTLVQELVEGGEITEEEAAVHPKRSLITRALDGRAGLELDLSVREAKVGDRYLLCSDGLSGVVSRNTITEALSAPEPQAAAERLVDLALRAGGPDNITALVADVVDAREEGTAPTLAGAAAEAAEADEQAGRSGRTAGAAGRAAALTRGSRLAAGLGLRRAEPERAPGPSGRRSRGGRLLLAGFAILLLAGLAAGVVGAVTYVHDQWYVGVAGRGTNERVAVYRGVNGSVGPLHLNSVQERGVAVSALPPEAQRQVRQHISADSKQDAHQILQRLALQASPGSSPGSSTLPAPSPSSGASTVRNPTSLPPQVTGSARPVATPSP
ncbi:MAG TPA: PP2C family serine/threonine-protein phosphatase [Mycobacteriales bacterium]|jgi:protein phosphatase|nr:PP2C family serine/threonine-protein phosphatase [Mycobacteriales bacterium]